MPYLLISPRHYPTVTNIPTPCGADGLIVPGEVIQIQSKGLSKAPLRQRETLWAPALIGIYPAETSMSKAMAKPLPAPRGNCERLPEENSPRDSVSDKDPRSITTHHHRYYHWMGFPDKTVISGETTSEEPSTASPFHPLKLCSLFATTLSSVHTHTRTRTRTRARVGSCNWQAVRAKLYLMLNCVYWACACVCMHGCMQFLLVRWLCTNIHVFVYSPPCCVSGSDRGGGGENEEISTLSFRSFLMLIFSTCSGKT